MATKQNDVAQASGLLAAKFARLLPLDAPPRDKKAKHGPGAKGSASTEQTLEEFYAFARQERLHQGLGIFKRARVAYLLQKNLLQAGYPPPLVKQVLFAMLISAFAGN